MKKKTRLIFAWRKTFSEMVHLPYCTFVSRMIDGTFFYKRLNFLSEGFLSVSWFLSELIMEKQWFRGFSSNDFFFFKGKKNLKKL